VEIPPICKDDLICLPTKLGRSFGDISPLVICTKVSNSLTFIDPFSLQDMIISSHFWHNPFKALADRYQLIEFIVIDVDLLGPTLGKLSLAEVKIAKSSDFGKHDKTYYTRTHLGRVLNPGDYVAGYDLSISNFNDSDMEPLKGKNLVSEIVLVKKLYPNRRKKSRQRHWKLESLAKESEIIRKHDIEKAQNNYEEFLRDLEEDKEMRSQIQLIKVKNSEDLYQKYIRPNDNMNENSEEEIDYDFPEVEIEELIEEVEKLEIDDNQEPLDTQDTPNFDYSLFDEE